MNGNFHFRVVSQDESHFPFIIKMICTYFHLSAGGQGTEWKFHFFCFVLQTSTGSLTWDESVGVLLATPDVLAEVQSGLHPLHAEVEAERDGVILVIDGQDVRNFET